MYSVLDLYVKEMNWSPLELKILLDPLDKVSQEAYLKIAKYIKGVPVKSKKVIKPEGQIENHSRILIRGLVGMFRNKKLLRIYFPNEIMMDADSYFHQSLSKYEFIALEDSFFSLLSREGEQKILEEEKRFAALSDKLITIARESNEKWMAMTQLSWREVFDYLRSMDPEIELKLSQKHLAEVLNINVRTLYRERKQAFMEEKIKNDFDYLKSNLKYPFKSFHFNKREDLSLHVFAWATYFHGFLDAKKDLVKFNSYNLPWLSARLYPEADWESSCWLAKFFLLLFVLDDTTDNIPRGLKMAFWKEINRGFTEILNHQKTLSYYGARIKKYIMAFKNLWEDLEELKKDDPQFLDFIQSDIHSYLKSNYWEAKNKDTDTLPSIKDYIDQRPVFSGARLSLSLIPMGMGSSFRDLKEVWKETELLMSKAEQLIMITNDLFSYWKEKKLNDNHNWISLLGIFEEKSVRESRDYLLSIHEKVLEEFMELDASWTQEYNPDNDLVLAVLKQVKYKVSGALEWSVKDTTRYLD